jgi:putative tricarboxylic transport membrane protein
VDALHSLLYGFSVSLTPINLFYCALGVLLGTIVGVLPGIGPLGGITILLPTTFGMEPVSAIIMLAGIYYGAMYGGSTTSILVNIPGEAASVVTCFDGYQMARKGRAGPALSIAAFGSYIAGTLSVLGLMLLAPLLASLAVRFGPPEQFSLMVLGLVILAYMGTGSVLKALMMIVLGLALAAVGIDHLSGFTRFTHGRVELGDGISFLAVAMGLFGIAEILTNVAARWWASSSASFRARPTSSRRSSPTPWRSACPGARRSSAPDASRGWRAPRPRTTRPPGGR